MLCVSDSLCLFIFSHLYQFLPMLQISFRPAVQCVVAVLCSFYRAMLPFAVLAMALCPSVYVCYKSEFY